ncbi:MAG: hypothetical protein ACI4DP_03405 [Candidatus Ornithomonoglobus sp.]
MVDILNEITVKIEADTTELNSKLDGSIEKAKELVDLLNQIEQRQPNNDEAVKKELEAKLQDAATIINYESRWCECANIICTFLRKLGHSDAADILYNATAFY